MRNDNKSLADVQPGGRVRLGDARALIQRYDAAGAKFRESLMDDRYSDAQRVELRRELTAVQDELLTALSPQPSPGGQDAAIKAMAESLLCAESSATLEDAREQAALLLADALPHLAAPQPVGISSDWVIGYLTTDAPEESREAIRNAFAEYAALSAARQPVGEPAPFRFIAEADRAPPRYDMRDREMVGDQHKPNTTDEGAKE
ncbi:MULTISPECIES: hypothetical protein [Stenotrophomonas maltophilia group]|uniref:hypothetical protein n=1 Tax=Stenotrophomonas maltophilia group TaxID=995085 RepID=UPI001F3C793D|nr:hypothetical protein [Stenotrophomonas maltophilia]MCF3495487.1 hypothetical protein [Stenotrophomonas maltophilia]